MPTTDDWRRRLKDAQLATVPFTDADGGKSIRVRTNEEAAEVALANITSLIVRAESAERDKARLQALVNSYRYRDRDALDMD